MKGSEQKGDKKKGGKKQNRKFKKLRNDSSLSDIDNQTDQREGMEGGAIYINTIKN